MAYRIHIAGVYGSNHAAFQEALSSLSDDGPPADVRADGQWLWASFSVWHVRSSAIAECLQTMPEPSVLVTSEDGMRWYLNVFHGDKNLVSLCHEFGLLGSPGEFDESDEFDEEPDEEDLCAAGICQFDDDFEELAFLWDEEEAARIAAEEQAERDNFVPGKEIISEQEELGCTLPPELAERLGAEADANRACQLFLDWQHQAIRESLQGLNVSIDEEKLADCFDPEHFTELESESDLGNMPRLVQALGMTSALSQMTDAPDQFEGPSASDQEWEDEPDNDENNDEDSDEDWDEEDEGDEGAAGEFGSEILEQINQAAQAMIDNLAGVIDPGGENKDSVHGEKLAGDGPLEVYATDAAPLIEGHIESGKIKQAMSELRGLGFQHVGDIVCPVLGGLVCACFAGPSEMHAHILIETYCCREFWTKFENGHVLTTNNEENMGESDPELGHYFLSYDELSMKDLAEKHRQGIDKFKQHKQTVPIVHESNRAAFAHHMTEFLKQTVL